MPNGDSVKQLLARSRYVLYESHEKWTERQNERAQMLFGLYPDIKKAHNLSQQLRGIYNNNNKYIAMTKLAHWYRNVEESGFKNFNTLLNTLTLNYQSVLNYFDKGVLMLQQNLLMQKLKRSEVSLEGLKK